MVVMSCAYVQPYLYTLVLLLKDSEGKVVDCEACRIGIRQITKAYKEVLVNGMPVIFRGVNRHEHHPRLGKTNIEACMIKVNFQAMISCLICSSFKLLFRFRHYQRNFWLSRLRVWFPTA